MANGGRNVGVIAPLDALVLDVFATVEGSAMEMPDHPRLNPS
jgi:hypothetical protein